MNIVNQYSYLLALFGLIGICFLLLRKFGVHLLINITIQTIIATALFIGLLLLRPGPSDVNSIQEARSLLNNGRPTFMEFFSNYCGGCVAFRPIVENVVRDIKNDFNILRIDIHTDFGRQLREEIGFSFTPEFILFNQQGAEVWRDHLPPSTNQLEALLAADT